MKRNTFNAHQFLFVFSLFCFFLATSRVRNDFNRFFEEEKKTLSSSSEKKTWKGRRQCCGGATLPFFGNGPNKQR